MHVLIVGAGPGGLAIAQCLRKQGISFEIFDRDTHDECRFQGFAIAIHSYVVKGSSQYAELTLCQSALWKSFSQLSPMTCLICGTQPATWHLSTFLRR